MPEFKIKLVKSAFLNEKETRQKIGEFVAKTEFFSMSNECKKFEEAFSKRQGRQFAVFVNSGSSANLILIQSLLNLGRIKKGDRVGVSALTWATNVMPLIQLGLIPVAIDCELPTLNVSSRTLKPFLKDIRALFITNVLGFCDDLETIQDLCEDNKIMLLEDNCESLGSMANGKLLGNFGLASTFSFFLGHHLSTIEGGMVCTDDDELWQALMMARSHGWDRSLPIASQKKLREKYGVDEFYDKYTFYDLAYNVRPAEINGFLGNLQINYWDEIVNSREKNFGMFQEAALKNDDFLPLRLDTMTKISNFAMPIVCKDKESFERTRNRFLEEEIEIRPIIAGNIERQPFFRKYLEEGVPCANTNLAAANGFYFPNNPELDSREISTLVEILKKR